MYKKLIFITMLCFSLIFSSFAVQDLIPLSGGVYGISESENYFEINYGQDYHNSVLIDDMNNHVYVGDLLFDSGNQFDDDDGLGDLLDDGYVQDDDYEDMEYKYGQKILIGNNTVASFERDVGDLDDLTDIPVPFIDLSVGELYTLDVDFADTINNVVSTSTDGEGLVNSEKIVLFGKKYAFRAINNDDSDELVLNSAENSIVLNSETSVATTVNISGVEYEIILEGGDLLNSQVIISVNGDTDVVNQGETVSLGGLRVYVDDIFFNDLNQDKISVAVRLLLGSGDIKIPTTARSSDGTSWDVLKVGGVNLDGYEVAVTTDNSSTWNGIKKIQFKFMPSDLEDEVEFLIANQTLIDPLFETISFSFDGMTDDDFLDNDLLEFSGGVEDGTIKFTNIVGDELEFKVFTGQDSGISTNVSIYCVNGYDACVNNGQDEILRISGNTLYKDNLFILNSYDTSTEDQVTGVYEVTNFDKSDLGGGVYDHTVSIRNVITGNTVIYNNGDEIENTNIYVQGLNSNITDSISFELRDNSTGGNLVNVSNYLVTFGGLKVTINGVNNGVGNITVEEIMTDDRDGQVDYAQVLFTSESDSDNTLVTSSWNNAISAMDNLSENSYSLTKVGTYTIEDVDSFKRVKMYASQDEIYYNVSLHSTINELSGTSTVDLDTVDSAVSNLENQGYNIILVNEKKTSVSDEIIDEGDIRVTIYDALSGGNLIYDSLNDFDSKIIKGRYDILLGSKSVELALEFGNIYYMDISINGEDIDFAGVERQMFQSTVGEIKRTSSSNVATGIGAFAGGLNSNASGDSSFALGYGSESNGNGSYALGEDAISNGDGSYAFGLHSTVNGVHSVLFNLLNHTGQIINQSNTFAVMGGKSGFGTISPNATLEVVGNLKISNSGDEGFLEINNDDLIFTSYQDDYIRNWIFSSNVGDLSIRSLLWNSTDLLSQNYLLDIEDGMVGIAGNYFHSATNDSSAKIRFHNENYDGNLIDFTGTSMGIWEYNNPNYNYTEIYNITENLTTFNTKVNIANAMRLEPVTGSQPSLPELGDLYVDGDTNELCFYNGSMWKGTTGGSCN